MNGDADFAERAHGHREQRLREVRRDDRRHAVGLEKPAHDAGFDVGPGAEDRDQISHVAVPGGARCASNQPCLRALRARRRRRTARGSSSTLSRIIVMSSCCGAPSTKALTSRRMRSRSSSDGRSAWSSSELAQAHFAEAVVGAVHRLADPVGEEHEEVAGRPAESSVPRAAARTSRRSSSFRPTTMPFGRRGAARGASRRSPPGT